MPLTEKQNAEHDYDVYARLRAISNSNVERFGIANVYYFAQWEGYYVMAMTLLDSYLDQKMAGHAMNKLDIIIIAKQFVSKISQNFGVHFLRKKENIQTFTPLFNNDSKVKLLKYVHSCNVCLVDFRLERLMFRSNQIFMMGA